MLCAYKEVSKAVGEAMALPHKCDPVWIGCFLVSIVLCLWTKPLSKESAYRQVLTDSCHCFSNKLVTMCVRIDWVIKGP